MASTAMVQNVLSRPATDSSQLQKKVAQLTKVVVFLNNQNEQSKTARYGVEQLYEDEIQTILGHARNKIKSLQTDIKTIDIAQIYKAAENNATKKLAAEIEAVRKQSAASEEERSAHYEKELNRRISEMVSMRSVFANTHKMMTEALATMESRSQKSLASQRNDHAERLATMSSAHALELTTVCDNHEAHVTTLQQEVESLRDGSSQSEGRVSQLNAEIVRIQQTSVEAQEKANSIVTELETTQKQYESAQEKIATLEALSQTLQNNLASADAKTVGMSELRAQIVDLEEIVKSKDMTLATSENSVTSLEQNIKTLTASHKQVVQEMSVVAEELRNELVEVYSAQQRQHETNVTAAANAVDNIKLLKLEKETLSKQFAITIADFKQQALDAERTIEQLRSLSASALSDTNEIRMQLETVRADLKSQQQQWTREKQRLLQQHESEIDRCRSDQAASAHEQLQRKLTQLLETQHELAQTKITLTTKTELVGTLQSTVAIEQNIASEAIAKLEQQLIETQDEISIKNTAVTQLETLLSELRTELNTESGLSSNLQHAHSEALTEVADLKQQLAQTSQQHLQTTEEIEAFDKMKREASHKHLFEVETLRSLHADKLRDSKVASQARNDALSAANEALRADVLRLTIAQDSATVAEQGIAAALSKLQIEHNITVVSRSALDEELAEVREMFAKTEQDHATVTQNQTNAHAIALDEAKQDCEVENQHRLDTLRKQHELDLLKVKQEGERALAMYRKAVENEKRTLVNNVNQETGVQLVKQLQELESLLRAEHATNLRELDLKHKSEIEMLEMQTKTDQERETRLQASITTSKSREIELLAKLDKNTKSIRDLRTEIECKGQELLVCRRECTDELALAKASKEHEIQNLQSRHSQELQRVAIEVDADEKCYREAIKAAEVKTQQWQYKYENRQSNPEDVARIKDLQHRLSSSIEKTARLEAQNREYLLEVRQQDQAMHMMFKQDPSVGNISPLRNKPKRAPSRRNPR